ncbi:hypothetical protein FRC01_005721 [Tulasnella sp. 417]|nr:hypothetical protein FRC01_005721 [Tulasnella sp. 417]
MGLCFSNPKSPKARAGQRTSNSLGPNAAGTAAQSQSSPASNPSKSTPASSFDTKQSVTSTQTPTNPTKTPATSRPEPRNSTVASSSGLKDQKSAGATGKGGSASQAPGPSEQFNYTGRVTTKNPPDTSYKLLNAYAGEVKGVKGLNKVTVKVLRIVGNGPNDTNFKKWTAAVYQRISKEISAWMRIKGPFIQYLGFATVDGVPAILTELEEGTTAKEFLAKKPSPIKHRSVLEFADAVRVLHKEQLPHGNLEPRHFMVDKKGKSKLGGFCFHQMIEEELRKVNPSEEYRRSARYTPPEVLESRPTSEKSDVYSFACVAAELLTGKIPFAGIPQEAAVTQLAINGEPHLTKQYTELQNDPWWATLRSCWSKRPEDRPTMETVYQQVRLDL